MITATLYIEMPYKKLSKCLYGAHNDSKQFATKTVFCTAAPFLHF